MLTISPANNHQQSFGMAYSTMKGIDKKAVSRRFAEEIHQSNAPEIIKEELKHTIEAIKALKTKVFTDGEKVIVEHPVSGGKYEVLHYEPWCSDKNGKIINYSVGAIDEGYNFPGKELTNITIQYPQKSNGIGSPAWDAAYAGSTLLRKHIMAQEIATEFDRQLAAKAAEAVKARADLKAVENTAEEFEALI